MKKKALILLMLTVVSLAPIHAVTKDQAAGVAITKEDQKVFDRLFKAIEDINVDEVQMVLKENERIIKSFIDTHRQKGLTALDKIAEKLKENSESALSRGEKGAITRKLNKIKNMIKAEEMMPKARAKRVKAEKPSEMRALPVME
jgi:predicted transcriptional regulator of viral defense system